MKVTQPTVDQIPACKVPASVPSCAHTGWRVTMVWSGTVALRLPSVSRTDFGRWRLRCRLLFVAVCKPRAK